MTSSVLYTQELSLPVGQTEKSSIFIQNHGTDQRLTGSLYDKIGAIENMDSKAFLLKSPETRLFVEELFQTNNKESFQAMRLGWPVDSPHKWPNNVDGFLRHGDVTTSFHDKNLQCHQWDDKVVLMPTLGFQCRYSRVDSRFVPCQWQTALHVTTSLICWVQA